LNIKKSEKRKRHYISSDAMLALERLFIGRECNAFDGFSTERKTLAYQELIRLGLVVGSVNEVAERNYPEVVIQGLTVVGRKLYQNHERGLSPSDATLRPVFLGIAMVVIVVIVILLVSRY
jgi:hypothetical protein